MKAFAIVLNGHPVSEHGFDQLTKSSERVGNDFKIERFTACTELDAVDYMNRADSLRWTWPWEGTKVDFALGLKKTAYQTARPHARVACFLSHFELWKRAVDLDEPILILEHDALFVNKFPGHDLQSGRALAINDPRGATRKAMVYHNAIQQSSLDFPDVPWVDDDRAIPQGLPGNSAYLVTPSFAKVVINFVERYGMWPNDATICKQNFPGRLLVSKTYYTTLQGLPSTTTR